MRASRLSRWHGLGRGYDLGAVNHFAHVLPNDGEFEHGSLESGLQLGLVVWENTDVGSERHIG